jgi:hypothetical protein
MAPAISPSTIQARIPIRRPPSRSWCAHRVRGPSWGPETTVTAPRGQDNEELTGRDLRASRAFLNVGGEA